MNSHFTRSKAMQGNGNAKKQDRRVEVGWLDYGFDTKEYKQLYQKTGGGIKHEIFHIDTSLSAVLEVAKGWFFPEGLSRRGHISDFDFFITDSSHSHLPGDITVGDMYELTKVKLLRLYIASKRKTLPGDVETPLSSSTSASKTKRHEKDKLQKNPRLRPCHETTIVESKNEESAEESLADSPLNHVENTFDIPLIYTENTFEHSEEPPSASYLISQAAQFVENEEIFNDTVLNEDGTCTMLVIEESIPDETVTNFIEAGTPTVQIRQCTEWHNFSQTPVSPITRAAASPIQVTQQSSLTSQHLERMIQPNPGNPQLNQQLEAFEKCAPSPTCLLKEPAIHDTVSSPFESQQSGKLTLSSSSESRLDGTVIHDTLSSINWSLLAETSVHNTLPSPTSSQMDEISYPATPYNSVIQQHDTLEEPRSPTPPPAPSHDVIAIHRSNVQQELISVFIDPTIVAASIKYRFIDELGADAQGVSREVYSCFWQQFFETSAVGENERVPAIFPDNRREEWEAIGRILLKGYVDINVYPIQLSYSFSCAAIYGEAEVSGEILVESLRMYLSDTDRCVIDKALMGHELDADDQDDFLDLLGRVNCHSIPASDEIQPMIIRIAHKELIQEPKYALDAIACVAGPGLKEKIPHPEDLRELYVTKVPNPRKVIKLLSSSPTNQEQAAALSFLKQFIKGLDDRLLKKFMRLITGSEFICTKSIEVTFNQMRGFARAPQIHTCGPLLELPCTYQSYPELRNEFMHILDANYMNMDVV